MISRCHAKVGENMSVTSCYFIVTLRFPFPVNNATQSHMAFFGDDDDDDDDDPRMMRA